MTNGVSENLALPAEPVRVRVTPVAPVWHTILLVTALLSLSILTSLSIAKTGGKLPNRLAEYVTTLIFDLILLGYIWLFGLRRYKVTIAEIIGGKWQSWGDFWRDMGVACLFGLVVLAVVAVLAQSLEFSGLKAAGPLLPHTHFELGVFVILAIVAGFSEEIVFRGYLQRQFTAWTGNVAAGVALQAAFFGLAHLYQGAKGTLVVGIYGAMFGTLAAMRKSLRPGIIQHCAQDSFAGIAGYVLMKYKYLQMIGF